MVRLCISEYFDNTIFHHEIMHAPFVRHLIKTNQTHNKKARKLTMKKRISKMMTMMMATTLVLGSSMTVHATTYEGDGCARDDGVGYGEQKLIESGQLDLLGDNVSYDPNTGMITIYVDGYGPNNSGSSDSGSSDSGSSYSEPSYSEPSYDYSAPSSDGGGSSESYSYDNGNSSSDESYSAPSGNGGSASSTAVAVKYAGSNTGVTGKEQFRALARSGAGTYSVTHKGIAIATFNLIDSEKNAKSCEAVALIQRADGKWAINFTVADATGLTVGAPLDRTYMYKTLGVSYVTINDEIVIDIEAEAAAAK
ncbi:MAG: hypothetical protein NC548_38020 [Lachnospiraceae bacterium]|nr:hypothetical protein [Lachnospiraceae bacterium]